MIAAVLLALILFPAAKLIHKDKDLIDAISIIGVVVATLIVSFLVEFVAGMFLAELPVLVVLMSLIAGGLLVFFMSNATFVWGYKRSAIFTGVYLISKVALTIGIFMWIQYYGG